MRYYGLLMCTLILSLMATQAYADEYDFLNPNDPGANSVAKEDIKHTMGGESIFNASPSAGAIGPAKGTVMISAKNTKFPQGSSSPSSVAGSLSLILTDSTIRSVTVVLAQSGEVVFGKGSMTSGGVAQDVSATGSVSGDKLDMDILSMNDINLYKLSMDINGKSLSGSYRAFSSSSAPWTGTLTGSMA